jgi:hypothetical protein
MSYCTIKSNFDLGTCTHTNPREKRATRSKDENAVESEGRGLLQLCNNPSNPNEEKHKITEKKRRKSALIEMSH